MRMSCWSDADGMSLMCVLQVTEEYRRACERTCAGTMSFSDMHGRLRSSMALLTVLCSC
jgi:hypothetical protein